jgi:hypothetical protein
VRRLPVQYPARSSRPPDVNRAVDRRADPVPQRLALDL